MSRLQGATMILETMERYCLPLLYGLLGASVYVLHVLSEKIKSNLAEWSLRGS